MHFNLNGCPKFLCAERVGSKFNPWLYFKGQIFGNNLSKQIQCCKVNLDTLVAINRKIYRT